VRRPAGRPVINRPLEEC